MASCGQKILLTGCSICEQSPQCVDPCQQLQMTTISQQWELNILLTGPQQEMTVMLSEGKGYTVSDGSFKEEARAAAWIIEGPTSELRLTRQWHTPGPTDRHSSFCSKVAGIVRVLYTLTFWPPMTVKPSFRIACDGLSVVPHLQMIRPIDPTEPHADLLMAAQNLLNTSNYKVELAFVCGHQDTGHPTVLTRDAWLNVEADLLTKAMVSALFKGPSHFRLPGNSWGCYTGTNRVVTQLQQSLQKFINRNTTLSYWEKRKQCSYDQLQEIDWLSLGQAMQSVPLSKCQWASKQMSGHFANGKNMVRWKQCTSA